LPSYCAGAAQQFFKFGEKTVYLRVKISVRDVLLCKIFQVIKKIRGVLSSKLDLQNHDTVNILTQYIMPKPNQAKNIR
jgi:hypothetical protein